MQECPTESVFKTFKKFIGNLFEESEYIVIGGHSSVSGAAGSAAGRRRKIRRIQIRKKFHRIDDVVWKQLQHVINQII